MYPMRTGPLQPQYRMPGQPIAGPAYGPAQSSRYGGGGLDFILQALSTGQMTPQQAIAAGVPPQVLQQHLARIQPQSPVNPYQVANNAPATSGAYSGFQPRTGPMPIAGNTSVGPMALSPNTQTQSQPESLLPQGGMAGKPGQSPYYTQRNQGLGNYQGLLGR